MKNQKSSTKGPFHWNCQDTLTQLRINARFWVSAFTESRNRGSVFWGTLHLHYLFNFRGSALRKINFMLFCNLLLSYAYLWSKLYLLLWRPMSHETTFCPFTLFILGRVAGRELGSHWHARWLALGPMQCCPRWEELWVRTRGWRGSNHATNFLFYFIHHLFYPATTPTTGSILVPSTRKWKKGHLL